MAGFTAHLGAAAGVGLAGGWLASEYFGLPALQSIGLAGAAAVSGLLPDLDLPSSTPFKRLTAALGVVLTGLALTLAPGLWPRLAQSVVERVILAAAVLIAVRFLFAPLVSLVSDHRGMFHSLPAAVLWGLIVALAARLLGRPQPELIGAAGLIGYLSHLVLDQLSAPTGRPLKLFGRPGPTVVVYGLIVVSTGLLATGLVQGSTPHFLP